ncbi:hypothetical protein [Uliginosibacterium gangwonense]|uniref:hypothetical protein n=1 Tax=Uliginosibacterium gangwonense TaxID=392736 RepID=UPI0012F93908|nr:hypothetical protein [Uliginosibacterium gangwonense]
MSLFIRCAVVCLASLGVILLSTETPKIHPGIGIKPGNELALSTSALTVNERDRVVARK